MSTRHFSHRIVAALTVFAAIFWPVLAAAQSRPLLPGNSIPQFVDPLPLLSVAGGPMETAIAGTSQLTVRMCEFKTSMLPTGTVLAQGSDGTTHVWGYRLGNCPIGVVGTYIGPVIVATRNQATEIKWINNLGNASSSQVLAYTEGSDQTLHWADPVHTGTDKNMCAHEGVGSAAYCVEHYSGTIPAVPHLHGGEVPPVVDGGPDAWFTSDGSVHGSAYYTKAGAAANEAIYRYPNTQEAGNLWFHDHTLGVTRLGVYAGLAGAYPLIDPDLDLPTGLHPVGLQQGTDGPLDYVIPLVIQDRSFYDNGELYIPHAGLNPEHPFWVPEFVGDTIVVNGKVWPFLNVEPRRYRFLIINGSNARAYQIFFDNGMKQGPVIWQIGTDGGYLDRPVPIDPAVKGLNHLVLMPGERADIIVDFSGFAGQTLILQNNGRHPFPFGTPPTGSTVGRIMQVRVAPTSSYATDASYNPASGTPIRTGDSAIKRLVNTTTGILSVTPNKVRQLTLNEVMGPGGPLEVLVNNTKWDATTSETPQEGETELWEIVNLTADAHPIHTHLTQFQLVNRQKFNVNKYNGVYNAAFTGGVFIGANGPPLSYAPSTASGGKYGGNPNVAPWLQGPVRPPNANEAGWKDTVITYPGEVTRFVVRYAPLDTPVNTSAANAFYPFDPAADGHAFVWHCHIIDHEDNEMMRPLMVTPNLSASRTITDY